MGNNKWQMANGQITWTGYLGRDGKRLGVGNGMECGGSMFICLVVLVPVLVAVCACCIKWCEAGLVGEVVVKYEKKRYATCLF